MGAAGSNNRYNHHGGIEIQLENLDCFGGQEISGIIHISITSPIAPSTVLLIFKGKETTYWRGRDRRNAFEGLQNIINFQLPIYRWDQDIQPGGYSLPFKFILPTNIPGTFYYRRATDYDTAIAKISYKFHGKLISLRNELLKGRVSVNVRQASVSYNTNVSVCTNAKMRTWCCSSQGLCKINANFRQDSYCPSQIADIQVILDNSQSQLDVVGVLCELICWIRFKTGSSPSEKHLDPIEDYSQSSFEFPPVFFSKEVILSHYFSILVKAGTPASEIAPIDTQLNLPSIIETLKNRHSTNGAYIECLYTVAVSADMDGTCMCCGDSPKIKNIMKIIPNQIYAPVVPVAPPNWNPYLLAPVTAYYDPRYEVVKNPA